jgi:hypothetical protein
MAAETLKLSADPCFGQMRSSGTYPIRVTIQNLGLPTRGTIRVHPGTDMLDNRTYSFPVDLPSGTIKVITAYPVMPPYTSGVTVEFDGSPRIRPVQVPVVPNYEGFRQIQVGYIGDDDGCLGPLRRFGGDKSAGYDSSDIHFLDCYCKPENALDRAPGYDSLQVLVLGEGAERLTDAQWAAIEQWAVDGGCVLFAGGAGSVAYLNSPGASPMSPLSAAQETTTGSLNIPGIYVLAKQARVALISGATRPGTYTRRDATGQPVYWRRRYGQGTVALLAVNPFADPIRGDLSAGALLSAVTLGTRVTDGGGYSEEDDEYQSGPSKSYSAATSRVNPFKVQLPPTSTVAMILVCYIVLAVPVTFFVLRKLGRLELAWVTTPILSIVFAFAFYLFTAQLYKAGLSRRATGTLAIAAGRPLAAFSGSSDLFFPRGGSYELAIPNGWEMENMGASDYGGGGGSDNLSPLDTIDTRDGIVAPAFAVTNLAFRRISYSQAVNLNGTIAGSLRRAPDARGRMSYSGTITNTTSVKLSQLTAGTTQLGSLAPGETRSVNFASWGSNDEVNPVAPEFQVAKQTYKGSGGPGGPPRYAPPDAKGAAALPLLVSNDHSSVTVSGRVSGQPYGPQSGTDVSGDSSVVVIVHIPVTEANP